MAVAANLVSKGSLLKVEATLMFIKEASVMKEARTDPALFAKKFGISLTDIEVQTLADVLFGTTVSPFARMPAGADFDKMAQLRKKYMAGR